MLLELWKEANWSAPKPKHSVSGRHLAAAVHLLVISTPVRMELTTNYQLRHLICRDLLWSQGASSIPERKTRADNRGVCKAEREAVVDEHTDGWPLISIPNLIVTLLMWWVTVVPAGQSTVEGWAQLIHAWHQLVLRWSVERVWHLYPPLTWYETSKAYPNSQAEDILSSVFNLR
jgi:hypothetical protein